MRGGPMRAGGQRPAAGLGPQAQAQLRQAWEAREADPAGSAAAFTRMADIATQRKMPGMAAHLHLEAARSHLRAGSEPAALDAVREAITQSATGRAAGKTARRVAGLVAELRARGQGETADAIAALATARFGLNQLPPPAAATGPLNRTQRRTLPTHCGTCGAPVDAVDHDEDGHADCRYCGVHLAVG